MKFMEEGEEEAAHLPVGLVSIIEGACGFELPTCLTQQDHRQLSGVMASSEHAGAEHQQGIIQSCPFAFLSGIQPIGNIGQLLDKKLIDLQPVLRVRVGEQMVNHIINPEVGEAKG